jgi:hypothetical protein
MRAAVLKNGQKFQSKIEAKSKQSQQSQSKVKAEPLFGFRV